MNAKPKRTRMSSEEYRLRERLAYKLRKEAEDAEKRAKIAKLWENVDYGKYEVRIKPSGNQTVRIKAL